MATACVTIGTVPSWMTVEVTGTSTEPEMVGCGARREMRDVKAEEAKSSSWLNGYRFLGLGLRYFVLMRVQCS